MTNLYRGVNTQQLVDTVVSMFINEHDSNSVEKDQHEQHEACCIYGPL